MFIIIFPIISEVYKYDSLDYTDYINIYMYI